jgi:hypothetical protein
MSRYIFPPELMAKFYDGNATAEETMMILHAAEKDPKLKEEIEFMYSFPEDLMDVDVSREEVKSAKIISIPIEETLLMAAEPLYDSQLQMTYLPMWRLAAQSKAYGQDMKAPNDCVVQCEQYVLQQFNIRKSIEDLKDLSKKTRISKVLFGNGGCKDDVHYPLDKYKELYGSWKGMQFLSQLNITL